MANALFFSRLGEVAGTMELMDASVRGRFAPNHLVSLQRQSLPTDSIGTFTLTLTNAVVGSAIQVEDQAGTTTLYNGVAAASTVVITLGAYAPGSGLNDLRIKVRKGSSAPFFQPFETLTTAFPGAQSIYVAQTPDE
jgi:hypothetical protein